MKKWTINKLIKSRLAFDENLAAFKNMNQSESNCLTAVKHNCYFLQGVKNQTPEICLAAVKNNGCSLAFVNEQPVDICLAAVKQNGLSFIYVKIVDNPDYKTTLQNLEELTKKEKLKKSLKQKISQVF